MSSVRNNIAILQMLVSEMFIPPSPPWGGGGDKRNICTIEEATPAIFYLQPATGSDYISTSDQYIPHASSNTQSRSSDDWFSRESGRASGGGLVTEAVNCSFSFMC